MNNGDILAQIYNIQFRWMKFKKGRNRRPTEFDDRAKDWITIRQREEIIDMLISLMHQLKL